MVYKSGQIFLPFCHNPRVWQTDGQTDRQTEFSSLDGACIPCSAVKINIKITAIVGSVYSKTFKEIWCRVRKERETLLRSVVKTLYSMSQKSSPPWNFLRYFHLWWTCATVNYRGYCLNMFICLHRFWSIYLNICMNCIIFTGKTPQILTIQFRLVRNSWIFRLKNKSRQMIFD